MKLTHKIFITLIGFYAAFGGVSIATLITLIQPEFVVVESAHARDAIATGGRAIDREVESLATLNNDWRIWDSLYQYADNGNQAFHDETLTRASLANAELDLMIMLDSTHRPVVFITPETIPAHKPNQSHALDGVRDELIALTQALANRQEPNLQLKGIIWANGTPLLVAAGTITSNRGTAPARGILIMGRWLTAEKISAIGDQLGIKLQLGPTRPVQSTSAADAPSDAVQVTNLDSNQVEAFTNVRDLSGKPIFGLSAKMSRDIHANAVKALLSVTVIYFGSGIIGTLIVFMTLNRLVLRRLSRLNRELGAISFNNRENIAVTATGGDEITATANAINQMINRLDNAHLLVQQSEAQFRMLTELATVGIYLTDASGAQIFVNEHYTLQSGLDTEANLGDGRLDAIHPEDRDHFRAAWNDATQSHTDFHAEYRFLKPDGSVVWIQDVARPLLDTEHKMTGYLGTITDITNRKKLLINLERQALYDNLTGLPNRVLFHDRLQYAFDTARRRPPGAFAVLFMDLDGFKAVNDSLGHAAGDTVLTEIAVRLTTLVRPTDTVARLSGDEFAILLSNPMDAQQAPCVAERMLDAVNEPITIGATRVKIGVSVGVALDNMAFYNANDLLNAADKAMYRAKIAGKNRVHVSPDPLETSPNLSLL